MNRKLLIAIGAAAVLAAVVLTVRWHKPAQPPNIPVKKPAAAPIAAITPPVASAPVAAVPSEPARVDAAVGTERMLLAHASLRDPKVANPDSPENRAVLQTMVTKALARAEKKP